jgi:peptidoglycan/LPS O-acetylase OafA/YrhL
MSHSAYYPRLDGIRAIAVLCVLVHHFGGPLAGFWDQGYYGVDLFFVVSGFLITSILLSSNGTFRECYVRFLGRRTLRIFPLYYATVFSFLILNAGTARDNAVYLVTYTWNYAPRDNDSWLFYMWSLSVEEQFYLFWPILVLLLRKRRSLLLMMTFTVITVGYAQLIVNLFPSLSVYNYTGLINRMGSLGCGAFGAMVTSAAWRPRWLYNGIALELVILLALAWSQMQCSNWRFPVMGFCSMLLVMKAAYGRFRIAPVETILMNKYLQRFGVVSYGIYLFHVPIGHALDTYLVSPLWVRIPFSEFGVLAKLRWHSWLVKLPLYSGLSWILATFSYRWFERPFLAYKDRWFPISAVDDSPRFVKKLT